MSDSPVVQEEDGQSTARERIENKFYVIRDNFQTLHDVSEAIIKEGVHDSELIFGIDYTKSNKTQGKKTFDGLSLHDTSGRSMNPYQQVICILGETIEALDKDGRIPAFGFGDSLFSLKPEGPCNGFNEVLDIYNKVTKEKELSDTLDFVPVIEEAVKIVKETRRYHILVIVTGGKIDEKKLQPTQEVIVEASKWPLSIVVIGVGDGPWETMKTFDDGLPERKFDNFQFVDFHETITGARNSCAALALRALMEIPEQYKLIKDHELLVGLAQPVLHVDYDADMEPNARKRREKQFYVIRDNYKTVHDVTKAMEEAGVHDCELIFGVDYTMSNKTQGKTTFDGLSLHDTTGGSMNPYQQVICILGETLDALDKDGRIPAFCFGNSLFPLKPEGPCNGFNEVLDIYNKVTKEKELSGTLDFVPIIEEAVKIVKETKKYHILVIVTGGMIDKDKLKPTQDVIVEASQWPLSIVVVGVGDGPWETMITFDDELPDRLFDNFQFVDFHKTIAGAQNTYAALALRALMEIPEQYKLIKDHKLLKQPDLQVDHYVDGEPNKRDRREKRFYVIRDNYKTLHDVTKAMADADLHDCELIFGIDYTISNKEQGQKTFGGLSLHDTSGPNLNPYQQVICILGETFDTLDNDGWIPAFCFCDILFPLKSEGPCKGFNEVLDRYNQVTKEKEPSGSADFVPLIEQAVKIVKETKKYHILVIITDGKIVNMKTTSDAIVEASKWPLSIVVIGVGDGPWEDMMELDDKLPEREFDNFQFVDFHKILKNASNTYAALALGALMEIPEQYQMIRNHELLRKN